MCYEIRRAEACVDKADHHTLVNAGETRFSQLLYSKVNGCTARGGWQHLAAAFCRFVAGADDLHRQKKHS